MLSLCKSMVSASLSSKNDLSHSLLGVKVYDLGGISGLKLC